MMNEDGVEARSEAAEKVVTCHTVLGMMLLMMLMMMVRRYRSD